MFAHILPSGASLPRPAFAYIRTIAPAIAPDLPARNPHPSALDKHETLNATRATRPEMRWHGAILNFIRILLVFAPPMQAFPGKIG